MASIFRGKLFVCYFYLVSLFITYGFLLSYKIVLPSVKVSSTSVTLLNFSGNPLMANLTVGLIFHHVNRWGVMSYDNISASAFNKNNNPPLFHDNVLLPFKQIQFNVKEANVRLRNTTVHVEHIEDIDDKKSGVSSLNFELRAIMSFDGSTWVMPRKTQIEVACKDMEVQFSSDSTTNLRFSPPLDCRVDGTSLTFWRKDIQLVVIITATVFVAIALVSYIVVFGCIS